MIRLKSPERMREVLMYLSSNGYNYRCEDIDITVIMITDDDYLKIQEWLEVNYVDYSRWDDISDDMYLDW